MDPDELVEEYEFSDSKSDDSYNSGDNNDNKSNNNMEMSQKVVAGKKFPSIRKSLFDFPQQY